jgi:thiamine pyrophosphate-dependent acetolactate synthase large subunit-like protein
MLDATWGQVPVVVLGGASESYGEGLRQLQEIDNLPIARSAQVKDAFHCDIWERIPQMTTWAFNIAQGGVPGCVFIDYPLDVTMSQGDPAKIADYSACFVDAKPGGDPKLIKEAVLLLHQAQQPLMSMGRGFLVHDIGPEVKEFVALTHIPVDTCSGTLGTNPLNIGMPLASDADVVLNVGKFSQGGVKGSLNADSATGKVIAIYPDASDMGRYCPVEIGLAGHPKVVLQQMIDEAKNYQWDGHPDWIEMLEMRREGTKSQFQTIAEESQTHRPLHPALAVMETCEWMADNNILGTSVMAADGADNLYWWFMFSGAYGYCMEFPGQIVGAPALQNSLGDIGAGIPSVIGAACALPGKFVFIPSLGDGAFGYNMVELETMARLNIPAVIVLHNNSEFGMVAADQRRVWGRDHQAGSNFQTGLHYEKVAEGLGCAQGEYVTEPEQIRPALDRAFARAKETSKPVLINLVTDPHIYVMSWPWWILPETAEGEKFEGMGM